MLRRTNRHRVNSAKDKIARHVAGRMYPIAGYTWDDYYQESHLSMVGVEASSSYLYACALNHCRSLVKGKMHRSYLYEVPEREGPATAEHLVELREAYEKLTDDRERGIYNGLLNDKRLVEIADEYGVSRQRVDQIWDIALDKMRKAA